MESYNHIEIVKNIFNSGVSVFSLRSLNSILNVNNEQTLHGILYKLLKSNIIEKIERDKYILSGKPVNDFLLANFLYQPSYVSFETALNFYGILSQFPYETTSSTTNKSVSKEIKGKTYSYTHLKRELYWGYEKLDNYLIALPEKALLDQLYLASKGLKNTDFDEYNMSIINRRVFDGFLVKFKGLKKFVNKVKLFS